MEALDYRCTDENDGSLDGSLDGAEISRGEYNQGLL